LIGAPRNNGASMSPRADVTETLVFRLPYAVLVLAFGSRANDFGTAAWAVQWELVAAVKQGGAQRREVALDEAAFEEPEAAQPREGVVVAEGNQCAEVAEAKWGYRLAFAQQSRQMAATF
jgi:hypothetical protein